MTEITREQILDTLQQDWGAFIPRFQSMTPPEQQQFLEKQGYAHLGDLLGHVIAWWQDCQPHIIQFLQQPEAVPPDYDIDAFNATAVERFHNASEEELIRLFETTRNEMIGLVESIPDAAFSDRRVARRLYAETTGHYSEHSF